MNTSFIAAMQSYGLEPPSYIEPDRLYRFPGRSKKPGNNAGWCQLYRDGKRGVFGDLSINIRRIWEDITPTLAKIDQMSQAQEGRP